MSLKPLSDKVIIKIVDEEEVVSSIGLIIQSDTKNTTVKKGEVVAVGPGRVTSNGVLLEMNVSVGDVVYFNTYESTPLPNTELTVVSEQSIYVVVGV